MKQEEGLEDGVNAGDEKGEGKEGGGGAVGGGGLGGVGRRGGDRGRLVDGVHEAGEELGDSRCILHSLVAGRSVFPANRRGRRLRFIEVD